MIQPLDFSSVRPAPSASPTQQPGRRQPAGRRRRAVLVVGALLVVGAAVAVWVFDLFGDDPAQEAKDLARYCQLVEDVDRAASTTGATSAPGVYDGSAEQLRAAAAQVAGSLDELRSLAPKPVRAEVMTLADWFEAAAGGDATRSAEVADSAVLVNQHRAGTCASGSGTSFGD